MEPPLELWFLSMAQLGKWSHLEKTLRECAATRAAFLRFACMNGHLECARWLVGLDPEYARPLVWVQKLQTWSSARESWLKAVVFAAVSRKESA